MGVFVTLFVGEIWPHKELMEENTADRREDTYFFDMGKRTDYDDDGRYIGYTGWAVLCNSTHAAAFAHCHVWWSASTRDLQSRACSSSGSCSSADHLTALRL